MANTDKEYSSTVKQFLDEALPKLSSESFFSRHIDELIPELPSDAADQIRLSFELYDALLEQYQPHSDNVMAMLVLAMEDSSSVVGNSKLDDLLAGKLKLSSPPELYMCRRGDNKDPYIVEEYKLPIQQNQLKPTAGCIYAYYRSHRNDTLDTYGQGFYFEHYPRGNAEHEWA